MAEKKQADERKARLAKALRNNLRRRKQVSRNAAPPAPSKPAGDTADT